MNRLWSVSACAAILAMGAAAPALAQDGGPAATAPVLRGPVLSWPGKVNPPMRRLHPVVAMADAAPAHVSVMAAPRVRPSRYAPEAEPSHLWRAAPIADAKPRERSVAATPPAAVPTAASASVPTSRDLPTSIYDAGAPAAKTAAGLSANVASPAAAPAQPVRTAALGPPVRGPGYGDGVRFYSLHRQYGLTPDAAPIPPQFFAATADLSDPPGPLPARTVAGAGTAAQALRARAASEASESADTSGQP